MLDLTAANPNVTGKGVNDEATTGISDVFLINYTGSRYAHVWLTHESEDVTFFARGHAIQSESNNVTLGPNESVAVGLRVDTRGPETDGLIDDITIHAKVAEPKEQNTMVASSDPVLSVSSFAPSPSTRRFRIEGAEYGERVELNTERLVVDRAANDGTLTLDGLEVLADDREMTVELDVANSIDRSFAMQAGLRALGTVTVDVTEGETRGATFEFSVARSYLDAMNLSAEDVVLYRNAGDGAGWTALETRVVGERGGRVRIEADTPGFSRFLVAARTANLAVTQARLEPETIQSSESASITADVTNQGSRRGSRTVAFTLDSRVVATRNVTLAPGNSTTVTASVSPSVGEYDVRVGEVDAGMLLVEAQSETTTSTTTPESTSTSTRTTTADTTSTQSSTGQSQDTLREVGGFSLPQLGGVAFLLVLVVLFVALARRVPRR